MNYFQMAKASVRANERITAMNTQTVTTPTSNAPSVDDYKDRIRQLGTQKGQGDDSQIKFALLMIEGAYHGRFDLQPNKHGQGVDDADLMAREYASGFSNSAMFNAKTKSHGKLTSNGRKCIRAGTSPQWGTGQPLANTNDFVDAWRNLRKVGTKGLDDCYNALMRYLTVQIKEPRLITGDALTAFCYKTTREEPTAAEILGNTAKLLHKLTVGKAPGCKEIDTSPEVKAAIASLNKRLTNIAKGTVTTPEV